MLAPPLRWLLLPVLLACACGPTEFDDELVDEDEGRDPFGNACANFPGGPLSGDELLVLINKAQGQQLRKDWSPKDLISVPSTLMVAGKTSKLRVDTVIALKQMLLAAKNSKLNIRVTSAYRSFTTQCITFSANVAANGLEHALKYSAKPGRSQHQLGTTVDLTFASAGWGLVTSIGDRPEGRWLAEHAGTHGFALSYPRGEEKVTGYAYEPWHFRFIGVPAAAELAASGMILEEYLQACQDGVEGMVCPQD